MTHFLEGSREVSRFPEPAGPGSELASVTSSFGDGVRSPDVWLRQVARDLGTSGWCPVGGQRGPGIAEEPANRLAHGVLVSVRRAAPALVELLDGLLGLG